MIGWRVFQLLAAFAGGSLALLVQRVTDVHNPLIVATSAGFAAYLATLAAVRVLDWKQRRVAKKTGAGDHVDSWRDAT